MPSPSLSSACRCDRCTYIACEQLNNLGNNSNDNNSIITSLTDDYYYDDYNAQLRCDDGDYDDVDYNDNEMTITTMAMMITML